MAFDFCKILPRGKENAIQGREVMALLEIDDTRELRRMVEDARASGQVICTSLGKNGGYYLPASRAEIIEWERTMQKRARSTYEATQSARLMIAMIDTIGESVMLPKEKSAQQQSANFSGNYGKAGGDRPAQSRQI